MAAGAMVGVGFDGESWVEWAVGGVILGVAVVAYLLGRAGAPSVAAIAGLLVLYAEAVEEVVDVDDGSLVEFGAVVVVFAVAVTALGWLLPHRVLIGVVVGAGASVTLLYLFAFPFFFLPISGGGGTGFDDYTFFEDSDIYVLLAYSGGLVLVWILAAWATGGTGFRVLAVVHTAVVVPVAMIYLAVEHPTWWGAGLAVAGGLVLLLALVAGRRAHRQAPAPEDDEPYEPFFGRPADPPPPATPAEGTPAAGGPSRTDDTVIAPASPATPPPPPDPKDRRPS